MLAVRTLLIVGCGDVARRTLPRLLGRYRVYALLRDRDQFAFWRDRGVRPIYADLDCAASLQRIIGLADIVLHFAPPSECGRTDLRTRWLLAALLRGKRPQQLIYVSTSGVYGDCGGEVIDETRHLRPTTERATRRLDAECQLRRFGSQNGICVCILRAPGIYAAERLPLERLKKATLALRPEDDVFTNHIHADDLAMLCCLALRYGRANRCYNASDDSSMKMGEYFDLVAHRFGLPRPPRASRNEAQQRLSALQMSFMNESRRMDNRRIKKEFRARLCYGSVFDGVNATRLERNH